MNLQDSTTPKLDLTSEGEKYNHNLGLSPNIETISIYQFDSAS